MNESSRDHVLARNAEGNVEFWLIADQVYRCDNGAGHDLFGCPRNRQHECSFGDWVARRGEWWWAHDVPTTPFARLFG